MMASAYYLDALMARPGIAETLAKNYNDRAAAEELRQRKEAAADLRRKLLEGERQAKEDARTSYLTSRIAPVDTTARDLYAKIQHGEMLMPAPQEEADKQLEIARAQEAADAEKAKEAERTKAIDLVKKNPNAYVDSKGRYYDSYQQYVDAHNREILTDERKKSYSDVENEAANAEAELARQKQDALQYMTQNQIDDLEKDGGRDRLLAKITAEKSKGYNAKGVIKDLNAADRARRMEELLNAHQGARTYSKQYMAQARAGIDEDTQAMLEDLQYRNPVEKNYDPRDSYSAGAQYLSNNMADILQISEDDPEAGKLLLEEKKRLMEGEEKGLSADQAWMKALLTDRGQSIRSFSQRSASAQAQADALNAKREMLEKQLASKALDRASRERIAGELDRIRWRIAKLGAMTSSSNTAMNNQGRIASASIQIAPFVEDAAIVAGEFLKGFDPNQLRTAVQSIIATNDDMQNAKSAGAGASFKFVPASEGKWYSKKKIGKIISTKEMIQEAQALGMLHPSGGAGPHKKIDLKTKERQLSAKEKSTLSSRGIDPNGYISVYDNDKKSWVLRKKGGK